MKIPSARKKQSIRFNLTPLIDVVFLLIIFFLVSSHFVRTEAGIEISLPEVESSSPVSAIPSHLVVTITEANQWFLKEKSYTTDQIQQLVLKEFQANPNLVIKLRCDENLKYQEVEPFIQFCQSYRISEIQFSAKEKK